jgi:hypothetical protein
MSEQKDVLEALKGWTEEQKAAALEALLQEAVANWPDRSKDLYFDDIGGVSGDLSWLSKYWGAASKHWGADSEEGEGEGEDLPLVSVLELLTMFSLQSVGCLDSVIEFVSRSMQDQDELTYEVTRGLRALLKGEEEDSKSEEG